MEVVIRYNKASRPVALLKGRHSRYGGAYWLQGFRRCKDHLRPNNSLRAQAGRRPPYGEDVCQPPSPPPSSQRGARCHGFVQLAFGAPELSTPHFYPQGLQSPETSGTCPQRVQSGPPLLALRFQGLQGPGVIALTPDGGSKGNRKEVGEVFTPKKDGKEAADTLDNADRSDWAVDDGDKVQPEMHFCDDSNDESRTASPSPAPKIGRPSISRESTMLSADRSWTAFESEEAWRRFRCCLL